VMPTHSHNAFVYFVFLDVPFTHSLYDFQKNFAYIRKKRTFAKKIDC
jgi:hypothetical protein